MEDQGLYNRAIEAMIKRLITCLVNEAMVQTKLVNNPEQYGLTKDDNKIVLIYQNEVDEFLEGFILKLKHLPLLEKGEGYDFKIGLLDPMDMSQLYYYKDNSINITNDVNFIMTIITSWNNLDIALVNKITLELQSCITHQYYAYLNRKEIPTMDSQAIEWEQSIIEGHPTHPMNKARFAMAPIPNIDPKEDLLNPDMVVCVADRQEVTILGIYDQVLEGLYEKYKDEVDRNKQAIVLVHELQVHNIKQKFPSVKILHYKLSSKSQATLRTVIIDTLESWNFKLPLGIKVTSALRTVSPWTTFFGPNFSDIAQLINDDKNNLIIIDEVASIVSNHSQIDMAKHLSCLIRQDVETMANQLNEKIIITAALTEVDFNDVSVLVKVLNLDTQDKCIDFFENYCKLYLQAFLTPVLKYGIAWESHLQNTLCRFKLIDNQYQLIGFAIRDFGGIKVHQDTLFNAIGQRVKVFNDDASQLAHTKEDMYHVAYHTMFMMNLHRIIRCLNLHYNGIGWNILRKELNDRIPEDHELRSLWLDNPHADFKAFIKMKLDGLFRDYIYTKVPNLLNYNIPEELKQEIINH